MNTLKILKGSDIKISVNYEQLCFVKNFSAKEVVDVYNIEEILSDAAVDFLKLKKGYVLTITALSHLDSSVFNKEPFTVIVDDGETVYQYFDCRLVKKERDVNGDKPILDKYTIAALTLKVSEA